ncbi:hypothetical protein [Streptomyces spectabilis]|uniref:Uncharacterized protein n=1 Tax=Streptomyces spectabilis TaxID=68270 RepID=A0A7W8EU26_STRST|nr:hypothetical protein [Streptomyces spectabilis]MBB5103270.1 hypothetical protein [Streptomyces spectabilis]MCI3902461.1 hypothetical protein [Streptomyces spectabilis]GGV13728.1 hypothetical protein GCM10010245_23940 [Streptomyces spectabilis]
MMRIIIGITLGVLYILWPPLPAATAAILGWLISQPLVIAFVLGAVARPHLHMPKGWTK